jgi:S1-C subfamily serine protease
MHRLFPLLLIIALLAARPVYAQTATSLDETNAQRATVLITQLTRTPAGQPVISCTGSGTLVSPDGLILTNAHIARGSTRCKTDQLLISLISRLGEPPVPTYYAEIIQINVGWDLAVLQITRTLDARPVTQENLSLPFVELGDSDTLTLDAPITVIGMTAIDDKSSGNRGSTALKRGTITNFLDESRVGRRAWQKTNAPIPARMSGGGAYDRSGKLVGIPTVERSADVAGGCRLVQDTNGDGRVDSGDVCIPSGGFIDALRPAKLARGLVRAAQLRVRVTATSEQTPLSIPKGTPIFDRLVFSPGITSSGMPTTLITSAPLGTKDLYLFFDYRNMSDETIYELRVTIDQVPNALYSLSPSLWSGGQDGLWYIGGSDQIWANGNYVFTLLINGQTVATTNFTIGGSAQEIPRFADILFGIPDPNRETVITGTVLPADEAVNAQFVYRNLTPETRWRQVWLWYDPQSAQYQVIASDRTPVQWDAQDGAAGSKNIAASGQSNLTNGRYRLELYLVISGRTTLAATSDFVVAGELSGGRVQVFDAAAFTAEPPVFGQAEIVDPRSNQKYQINRAVNASPFYPNTTNRLYAGFLWKRLAVGTPWTWRVTVDDSPLFEQTAAWQGAQTNPAFWLRFDAAGNLPDGSYKLEVYVEGILMSQAVVKIGIGQLPIETFLRSSGVQLQGLIRDSETQRGVAGVMFIVIRGNVVTREFTWNMSEVVEIAITDSQGQFQLNRLLPRGQTYNLLVVGRGYLPLATDGLRIDDRTKNPLVLSIDLNKD